MVYWLMALMGGLIVAADQLTKLWVLDNIKLGTWIPGISGIFQLTYVQNFGAAFSSFQGQRWLFVLVFVLFTAAVIWEFSTKKMGFTAFERWCIAAVYAGGLGNMIDRICRGFVVDMIDLSFMDFPVFNVADCFITCGCILLMLHLIFWNRAFWKDEKKCT